MERPQNKHLKQGPGPGRPAGSLNKATREIKELARAIVEDPAYRKKLRRRMIEGKASHIEPLLWYYAYGKPKERVEVSDGMELKYEYRARFAEIMADPEAKAAARILADKLAGIQNGRVTEINRESI